jgi:hypothetical protein
MSINIVQFKDGKYGIRKGWLIYKYRDLYGGSTWKIDNGSQDFIESCKTMNKKRILGLYNNLINPVDDDGVPIDPVELLNTLDPIQAMGNMGGIGIVEINPVEGDDDDLGVDVPVNPEHQAQPAAGEPGIQVHNNNPNYILRA